MVNYIFYCYIESSSKSKKNKCPEVPEASSKSKKKKCPEVPDGMYSNMYM